ESAARRAAAKSVGNSEDSAWPVTNFGRQDASLGSRSRATMAETGLIQPHLLPTNWVAHSNRIAACCCDNSPNVGTSACPGKVDTRLSDKDMRKNNKSAD